MDDLSTQERKLVRELAKGKTQKAAGIAAGYAPRSVKSTISALLRRNYKVQSALYRLMEQRGLGDDPLLHPIKEALTANKVISARVIVKSNDPTVTVEAATSRTDDFIEVPDHPTRLHAAELGMRLRHPELFHPPKEGTTPTVPPILILVRSETPHAAGTTHPDGRETIDG